MTADQLAAENDALHGLLANACVVLHDFAETGCECKRCVAHAKRRARDVLAQIQEGVVT